MGNLDDPGDWSVGGFYTGAASREREDKERAKEEARDKEIAELRLRLDSLEKRVSEGDG